MFKMAVISLDAHPHSFIYGSITLRRTAASLTLPAAQKIL